MQAWRRLRHWSMPSSIMLCYTPTHTSNRCRLKSFTSCAFCGTRCPRFCNEMYWGQGCSVARSLEVLRVSYIIALSDWRSKWCTECQRRQLLAEKITPTIIYKTRSSADADNRLNAFTITGAPVNTTVTYNEAILHRQPCVLLSV